MSASSSEPHAAFPIVTTRWPPWKRVGFRFLFVYLVLYALPFPLDYLSNGSLDRPWMAMWAAIIRWSGRTFFHVIPEMKTTGSGDMTWNYVHFVCLLAISAIATLLWTLLDRKRENYITLFRYLHTYIRFALAAAMFSYGIAKVIPTQFPPPALDRLVESYGASSPMGILWSFMGASTAYVIFSGCAEMLGGLLLIMRRTMLLGALVSAAVLTNIVALNFFYDVPVKLYSLHLLLMAVFIAAPDARKLFDFFIRRPVEPLFEKKWAHGGALVFRTLLIGLMLYLSITQGREYYRQIHDVSQRSPLRGVWNINVLDVDGVPRPPLVTDTTRWRRFVFDFPTNSSLYLMSDERVRYNTKLDPKNKTMQLTNRDDPKDVFTLAYVRPDPKTLQLDGTVGGKKIHAVCTLADEKQYLLMNRGFHWINERPYNR